MAGHRDQRPEGREYIEVCLRMDDPETSGTRVRPTRAKGASSERTPGRSRGKGPRLEEIVDVGESKRCLARVHELEVHRPEVPRCIRRDGEGDQHSETRRGEAGEAWARLSLTPPWPDHRSRQRDPSTHTLDKDYPSLSPYRLARDVGCVEGAAEGACWDNRGAVALSTPILRWHEPDAEIE